MKLEMLEEIKEEIKIIQENYDQKAYVSTNDADELIKLSRELIKDVERLQKVDDSMDALQYGINNPGNKTIKPDHVQEIKASLNATELKTSDESKRQRFGTIEGYNKWDLCKMWLTMTNDDFFGIYGFNWVPPTWMSKLASEYIATTDIAFLGGDNICQKAEKEQENGTLGTKSKQWKNWDLNQLQAVAQDGSTKKMGKMSRS